MGSDGYREQSSRGRADSPRHRRRRSPRSREESRGSQLPPPKRHTAEVPSRREDWSYSQDGLPEEFQFDGFRNKQFNVVFRARPHAQVNGRQTYWDETGEQFVYYQQDRMGWALCPRKDADTGEDLFVSIQQRGLTRGLAFEEERPGVWQEYLQGKWVKTDLVRCRKAEPRNDDRGRVATVGRRENSEGLKSGRPKVSSAGNSTSRSSKVAVPPSGAASVAEMKRLLEADPDVEE
ncbi:unnamed protein product, partial [Polarella glacialis]